jgi:hypothetical protein
VTAKRRLLNCDEVMETSLDQIAGVSVGGSGPDSKQKMLAKNEKAAVDSNRKVNKAETSVKPMRRR